MIGSDGKLKDQSNNPLATQYIQYIVTMTTSDSSKTPALNYISFTWL